MLYHNAVVSAEMEIQVLQLIAFYADKWSMNKAYGFLIKPYLGDQFMKICGSCIM